MTTTHSPAAQHRLRRTIRSAILARAGTNERLSTCILLGITEPALRNYEKGGAPSFRNAQTFAPLLGLSPETGKALVAK